MVRAADAATVDEGPPCAELESSAAEASTAAAVGGVHCVAAVLAGLAAAVCVVARAALPPRRDRSVGASVCVCDKEEAFAAPFSAVGALSALRPLLAASGDNVRDAVDFWLAVSRSARPAARRLEAGLAVALSLGLAGLRVALLTVERCRRRLVGDNNFSSSVLSSD